jgi:hypothetical protein
MRNPSMLSRIRNRALLTIASLGIATSFQSSAIAQEAPTLVINQQISKAWESAELKPSRKATDYEFVRRVYIDLIGRIPSADEAREFVNDGNSNKRARLVNRLLNVEKYKVKDSKSPTGWAMDPADPKKALEINYANEYAAHWANIWTIWLMTRNGSHERYKDQMKLWLEDSLSKNMKYDEFVTKLITATGKTNENGAVNFVASQLGEASPADKKITDGPFDAVPVTSRTTRIFLGIQTQCVQCHDHPFSPEWKQEHFWGVNAFYRQVARDRTPTPRPNPNGNNQKQKDGNVAVVEINDDTASNTSNMIFFERRNGQLLPTKSVFLPDLAELESEDASKTKKVMTSSGASRRVALADYVIKHDNFAKAYVNRIWGHLFGRGLNEQAAFDDFGSHNKVLHEELLSALAKAFIEYKYDSKKLIEWICNSDAYQLSTQANGLKEGTGGNAKGEHEPYFSRMLLKNMSPEVLFDALSEATRADSAPDASSRKEERNRWLNDLSSNFGDDEGNEVNFNGTIIQALKLMNGTELHKELTRKGSSTVEKVIKRNMSGGKPVETAVINELYLTALTRVAGTLPSVEYQEKKYNPKTKKEVLTPVVKLSELAFIQAQLSEFKRTNDFNKNPQEGYKMFFEDLFWSLLNTNEFILNH